MINSIKNTILLILGAVAGFFFIKRSGVKKGEQNIKNKLNEQSINDLSKVNEILKKNSNTTDADNREWVLQSKKRNNKQ